MYALIKVVDKEKTEELDKHWKEVMDLASKYGFIVQAYGGVATLMTHKNQTEQFEPQDYLYRQEKMMNVDVSKIISHQGIIRKPIIQNIHG